MVTCDEPLDWSDIPGSTIIPPLDWSEESVLGMVKRFALAGSFCLVVALIVAIVDIRSAVATTISFVQISNPVNQPVPVREVERPWQTQLTLATTRLSNLGTTTATWTVPAGQRVTIEFVTAPSFASNP